MKFPLIAFLLLITTCGFAQNNSFEDQLKLRFTDNYIEQLKVIDKDLYNFYLSELKISFEFVSLRPNLKYNDLTPYDHINKVVKDAPEFSEATFSLYNYKFIRYKDKDIVYRIPDTNQGILIYSKEKFKSKL